MVATHKIGISSGKLLKNHLFEPFSNFNSGSPSLDSKALIGIHSYMNGGGYFRHRVIIGRYVSIGRRVTIGAGNHWTSGLSSSPSLSGEPPERAYTSEEIKLLGTIRPTVTDTAVAIGHDVWVGDGAIIMPGRKIGTGAVIGANAVVTKDVAPYTVVGGVPAKLISQRFSDEIIRAILTSEWWELSYDTLRSLPLGNIIKCIPAINALKTYELIPTYTLDK